MTAAFILIAVILILGGGIAMVGDRIGTRVGKARLSLFKLRPRKTAILVTFLTGIVISASTLGTLFALSDQLRKGVFELDNIQRDLRRKREQLATTRQQLQTTTTQKTQIQTELAQARAEQKAQQIEAEKRQAAAQKRLAAINQSLRSVVVKQAQTQAKLNRTQTQLSQVTSQFQQASSRLQSVAQQVKALRSEIQQRQTELQQLVQQRNELKAQITQRDQEIAKLDREINQRDQDILNRNQIIAQRETRLKQLEKQQQELEQEAQILGRNLRVLRQGNVAIGRGQVLAAKVVRVVKPSGARRAVEQILREANRNAMQLTQPGIDQVNEQVVNISEAQVEQLIQQIADGRDYLVRIIAAGNYVLGEKPIRVFADVALNQLIFPAGDILAEIAADPTTMTADELQKRVDLLLGAAKFRAQQAGMIMGDTIEIGDNRIQTLIRFFEQLRQYNQPVQLKAIAAQDAYTAGPLQVELVAVNNGQVVFSTNSVSEPAIVPVEPSINSQPPALRKLLPSPKKQQEDSKKIKPQNSPANSQKYQVPSVSPTPSPDL